MDIAEQLPAGRGYAELTAGAGARWGEPFAAFVRGELVARPLQPLKVGLYGEATTRAWHTGAFAHLDF